MTPPAPVNGPVLNWSAEITAPNMGMSSLASAVTAAAVWPVNPKAGHCDHPVARFNCHELPDRGSFDRFRAVPPVVEQQLDAERTVRVDVEHREIGPQPGQPAADP